MKALGRAALVLAVALGACSQPKGYEQFVGLNPESVYEFSVPFTDSLELYALDFYTRVDASTTGVRKSEVRLDIDWTSPSGSAWSETVYMVLDSRGGNRIPYRDSIAVPECGTWNMRVRVGDAPKRLNGLGIVLYGTR